MSAIERGFGNKLKKLGFHKIDRNDYRLTIMCTKSEFQKLVKSLKERILDDPRVVFSAIIDSYSQKRHEGTFQIMFKPSIMYQMTH